MGKASSAKKVARAARAGGSSSSKQRKLIFPIAVAGIVVAGVLVILFARGDYSPVAAESPKPGEHWHQAYGFYVCDSFLPPVVDVTQDRTGIHTHGDGIIHTHPFSNAYAGENATLGVWGETVGVDFGDQSWDVSGTTYENGYDCDGQPAELSVHKWSLDDLSAEPEVFTSGFADLRLDSDRLAFTFAVVPAGTEVPYPESVTAVDQLDPVTDNVVPQQGATTPPTSTLEVPVPSSDPAAAGAQSSPGDAGSTPSTDAGASPSSVP